MSSVWMSCPSKRPPEEAEPIFRLWRERGYKLALLIDWNPPGHPLATHFSNADILLCGGGKFEPNTETETRKYHPNFDHYPGYALAQNALIAEILARDPECEWVVAAADDIEPDANHSAKEIAAQCTEHFARTFGVMQCTGDRWGDKPGRAYIDHVAGSPWIGREFARRMYGGKGPYWPEYTHMGVDEELRAVAVKYGCYWERRDLMHFHRHWGRAREGERMGQKSRMPAFLAEANSPEHWKRYKAIFAARQAAGFPGSEPIA